MAYALYDIITAERYLWDLPEPDFNRTHAHNIVDYIRRRAEPNYGERFGFAFDASFGADWRVPREVLSKLLEEPWMTMSLSKDISRP